MWWLSSGLSTGKTEAILSYGVKFLSQSKKGFIRLLDFYIELLSRAKITAEAPIGCLAWRNRNWSYTSTQCKRFQLTGVNVPCAMFPMTTLACQCVHLAEHMRPFVMKVEWLCACSLEVVYKKSTQLCIQPCPASACPALSDSLLIAVRHFVLKTVLWLHYNGVQLKNIFYLPLIFGE